MEQETTKPNLSRKQRTIAICFMVIGFFALVTPLTPGAWLGLVGLGMWLGKTPRETFEYLGEKWGRFKKGKKK